MTSDPDGNPADSAEGPGHDHMSSWIELFYDLIFVAAILIFSIAVAHVHPSTRITWIVIVFAASWWVWFVTTVCANRFHMTDFPHRLLLLFQMLVIVLMAMEARVSVAGDSTYLAGEYGLLLVTVAIMFARGGRQVEPERRFARQMASVSAAAAVLFFVATTLDESQRLALSVVGLVVAVAPAIVLLHRATDFSATEERHLVERMGAFTLIVCGESFVEVALSVSSATLGRVDIVSLTFEFVLVFALFTGYFEDIPAAGVNQRLFGWWASLHLVAQVCIAATAIGASKLTDLSTGRRLPDVEILKLTLPLTLLFVALGALGACTRRRPVQRLLVTRLVTAGAIAVVGVVAWWIPWIHMVEALPMLTVVAIVQAGWVVRELRRTSVVTVATPRLVS